MSKLKMLLTQKALSSLISVMFNTVNATSRVRCQNRNYYPINNYYCVSENNKNIFGYYESTIINIVHCEM